MNILITRPFRLFIPQLIVDVEWINKMRQQYIKQVNVGDIVPEEYFTISVPDTTVNWDEVSVNLDGESKIIYSTHNVSYKWKWELTEDLVTVSIGDFVYTDL